MAGARIGHVLPDNWQPSTKDRQYGRSYGLTDQEIDDCAEDMRLWAQANANRQVARKSNWSAAFLGWMRRVARAQHTGIKFNGHKPANSTMAAFDDLIARARSEEVDARPEPIDITHKVTRIS